MPKLLPRPRHSWILACLLAAVVPAQESKVPAAAGGATSMATDNPYRLQPFHADFPVPLDYPPPNALDYERTRRQMLDQVARNLTGDVRRETWLLATEFYWRAPEDAIEPLIEAMDRAIANPSIRDVVKNCAEAMGKMANQAFDKPLHRALMVDSPAVQQAALLSLTTCGTDQTLIEMGKSIAKMDGRSRAAWLRAVRLRLGKEGVEILRDAMMADYPGAVRDQVMHEALQLPPADAATVLRGRWDEAIGEFKAIIAGVLHAAGDPAGTAWLNDGLRSEDLMRLTYSIRHCGFGQLGSLREPLLRASTHLRSEIRFEVAKALIGVDGDDVADVYEVLSGPDETWDLRSLALHELTRRGRTKAADLMLDELPTATGTRLSILMNELTASGDARAVAVMLSRFEKAADGEGRPFLQSLAQNPNPEATKALLKVFLGPDRVVSRSKSTGVLTTRGYVPTLLLNQRGREQLIIDAFAGLSPEQWQLRALLLPTLSGMAGDRVDPDLQQRCLEPVRKVLFDHDELPQMRVLALNLMTRRWLTIEDALKLKNLRRDESPGLQRLITNFLHDSF